MMSETLEVETVDEGGWAMPAAVLRPEASRLRVAIRHVVANATSGKLVADAWKVAVATEVKNARDGAPWDRNAILAVSIGFRFHPPTHNCVPFADYHSSSARRRCDVDNYLKPVLDAVARGLFWLQEQDPAEAGIWDHDDWAFRYVLAQRILPEAESEKDEGALICVSAATPQAI